MFFFGTLTTFVGRLIHETDLPTRLYGLLGRTSSQSHKCASLIVSTIAKYVNLFYGYIDLST